MADTAPPRVRTAGEADRARLISLITLAFATDPMARWAMPDAADYLAAMPDFADAFGGPGIATGGALICDGGGALWLPPGEHPDSERMGAIMQGRLPDALAGELGAVFEQMDGFHPEAPHWYLPLIGVDPDRQGRGCGAALMRAAVERCDREGSLAYLESSNPRNISLYLRHGFEILGTVQEGSSPVMTPMLRRPA
ncbi:MAG: N-acetyltransferase [Pseudomonadales bacterium]